jgi:hypothetical protein
MEASVIDTGTGSLTNCKQDNPVDDYSVDGTLMAPDTNSRDSVAMTTLDLLNWAERSSR